MPGASRIAKKEEYHAKLCSFLAKYDKAFLVGADNVGSKQFQDIRRALRPKSVVLMGKNTMIKRSLRLYAEETGDDKWNPLLDLMVGNVGIIFTETELSDVKDEIAKYKVGAAARVGLVAPNDVFVPPGPTGMDPSQTSFFQVRAFFGEGGSFGLWAAALQCGEAGGDLLTPLLLAPLLAPRSVARPTPTPPHRPSVSPPRLTRARSRSSARCRC